MKAQKFRRFCYSNFREINFAQRAATISSFFREINYALKIRRFCYSKIPWNQLALKFRYFMSYPKNKMCTYIWCDEYACVMDKADDISKNKFSSKWSEQRLPQCNEVIFFLFWKVDLLLLHICLPCLIEFVCIKLNINTLRRNGYVIWTSQRVLDVMKYLKVINFEFNWRFQMLEIWIFYQWLKPTEE